MNTQFEIHGMCDERFTGVRDAFAANFESGEEVGASFAATVEGRFVVDLWAGYADYRRTRFWERDTIINVNSVTKAMASICAHILVDRELLDLDAPVARYWPEFAQAGKDEIPVRYVLSHQAGLSVIEEPLPTEAMYDWERMIAAIASQRPLWEPGTKFGYHRFNFGFIVGELVRRVSGKSIGGFFQDEVALPLGADIHIGLPEEHDARVADYVYPSSGSSMTMSMAADEPESELEAKVRKDYPPMSGLIMRTRAWRAAEIPSANGHGNARSLARVMSALACGGEIDGVRLLSEDAISNAIEEQVCGRDMVLGGEPMRWGLGFMLAGGDSPATPNPRTFGHGGAGGFAVVGDLDARVSWAYTPNKLVYEESDSRMLRNATALYESLG